MDAHFISSGIKGQGIGGGTSLAVAQFVALVRGDLDVQRPSNPVKVESVIADSLYCLGCLDVRMHDLALDKRILVVWQRCRCCGKENWR